MQRPIEPKSHAVTSPSSRSRSRSTGSRSREPRGWGSCPSRAHRDSRCSAQTCGLSVDGPKTSHLISPGDWRLVPDPSDRFGVAPPVDITLLAGEKSHVTLDYDGRVPARCSPGAAAGHLDGDDRPDFASHMWVGGEATLGVCAGNGDYYKIAGKGQSELLFVGDVEGDGRDEIFFGANTCCQNFLSIAVIDDGDLREVARPSGRPFVLKQRFSDPGNRHSSE